MKLVFLGAPGVGKGTQAAIFCKSNALSHLSTGDMLREAMKQGTPLGKKVQQIVDAGHLVSDDIILSLMRERMASSDCQNGYVLDGFPRTVVQGEGLEALLQEEGNELDRAVYFELSEQELFSRLDKRRTAEGRVDDSVETQRERLRVYQTQTAPLIEFYRKRNLLSRVDADGSIEEVQERLVKALSDSHGNTVKV